MSTKDFYRAFEDKHRGSRELIKQRLRIYLPFILPLKDVYPEGRALDIGCGRGEWLELLKEHNILAQGIDFDQGMLTVCHRLDLDVISGDGFSYLKEQSDESLTLVSAFQVVEHISFEELQDFVQEALRVLKPGGMLIMETPNPENIKVATESFYYDPTHIKPIPLALLSFLPEFYGFARTKTLRLQESKTLLTQEYASLLEVIEDSSPDYAVVAQKQAERIILKPFDEVFNREFGLSLRSLTDKFENRLVSIEVKAAQAEAKATQAEAKATQAETNYHALLNSTSWKITKPLRRLGQFIRWFITGMKHWVTFSPSSRPRRYTKNLLFSFQNFVENHPTLKKFIKKLFNKFPILKIKLKGLQQSRISEFPTVQSIEEKILTRQAYAIYSDLKQLCTQPLQNIADTNNKKIAIVTPLSPDKTGIADYVSDMLPSLSEFYDIEIVTETANTLTSYPVRSIEYFKNNFYRYSRVIYQIGNNPFHWYMLNLMKKYPGIVVLHDFYLGDLFYWVQYHKDLKHNAWDNALIESHGYSSIYMREKHGYAWTLNTYPANIHVLQYAKAVIVHSVYAKQLASSFYAGKYNYKIHYLEQVHQEVPEVSDNLSDEFLVCSFGHIAQHKQVHRIISSWIETGLSQDPKCRLVFIGDIEAGDYGDEIQESIREIDNIEITGYISQSEFDTYLKSSSIAIQLRLQSRGETSRAVLDCLAYGIPTIINAHGSMKEFDKNCVLKIPENFTNKELSDAIILLYKDKKLRNTLSVNGKSLIKNLHNPAIVTKRMKTIVEEVYNSTSMFSLLDLCQKHSQENLNDQTIAALAKEYDIAQRSQQMTHLYVDISVVAQNDLKTGIQRVVRAILISLFEMKNDSLNIIPIYLTSENGLWQYKIANHFIKNMVHDFALLSDTVVEPVSSDIFLGLDLYTGGIIEAEKANLFTKWKKRGVMVNFLIYDILPIQFPTFFPENAQEIHLQWFETIRKVSNNLVCISKAVADEVSNFMNKQQNDKSSFPKIKYFHLGADIEKSLPSKGISASGVMLLKKLDATVNFSMIGTIEPRKGHLQTLLAFEELWNNNIDINLLIVGKEGWLIKELTDKIRQHPERNKHLYWIEDASDEYLTKIYRISTCLIAASEGEGFGLPLIEAAQYKVPIIARDIPVFREVAGKYAYYFENDKNPNVLSKAIIQWLELYKYHEHPCSDNMPWLTWEESTKQLLKCLRSR